MKTYSNVNVDSFSDSRSLICMQVLGGALLIGLSAHLKIFLPFTPVPMTLQTFIVMGLGACLGSRKGALAVITFLIGTSLGMPFTAVNPGHPFSLMGATGGYIFGFVLEAYLVGWVVEKFNRLSFVSVFFGISLAALAQLLLGSLWLSFYVGFSSSLQMGLLPFLPGEFLKALAVSFSLKQYRRCLA
jgi:biotin transport system substrate-specific component